MGVVDYGLVRGHAILSQYFRDSEFWVLHLASQAGSPALNENVSPGQTQQSQSRLEFR
ncbi:hypothetical protein AVEN_140489-1, partial [Araneus ventricosus]